MGRGQRSRGSQKSQKTRQKRLEITSDNKIAKIYKTEAKVTKVNKTEANIQSIQNKTKQKANAADI